MTGQEFLLKEASLEQIIKTHKNTHSTWGKDYTLEEYLKREEKLRASKMGFSLIVWVLVKKDELDSLNLYAHCETYTRKINCLSRP